MTNENNNEEYNEKSESHIIDELIEVDLPAMFGDLVEVEGYGPRVFKVASYRIENWNTPGETWNEVVYELIDAVNGEWLEADAEDIDLLADAEDEAVYMQTVDIANYPKSFMELFKTEGEAIGMAKGNDERKLSPREASAKLAAEQKQARKERYEVIDNELDRYNFFKRMYEKTSERRYKESMDTVMAEIKKLRKEGE